MDPTTLPPFELLLASPACQGHSRARGKDRPHHDASRATALCVINVAEVTRPRLLVVENVPDFRKWVLYPDWRSMLERLGYHLTENVLDASEFGVPQERERLFVVGRLGASAPVLRSPRLKSVPAASFIDWHAPGWSPVVGHAPATLARVARGRAEIGTRFLMPYYKSGSGLTGRSLSRPVGTITTKARWAVVDGDRMRMLNPGECSAAMAFPSGYALAGTVAEQHMQLGNAVPPPLARGVVAQVMEAA